MSIFLCYDLKGIQQYIFQVPRLKCCIGGSRQIDNFDRKEVVDLAKQLGIDLIYSGGGKGAFVCSSEDDLQNLGSSREFVGKSVRDTSEPAVSQAAIRHNRSPAGRFYSVCRLTAART